MNEHICCTITYVPHIFHMCATHVTPKFYPHMVICFCQKLNAQGLYTHKLSTLTYSDVWMSEIIATC
jgi:hypothetical protein